MYITGLKKPFKVNKLKVLKITKDSEFGTPITYYHTKGGTFDSEWLKSKSHIKLLR